MLNPNYQAADYRNLAQSEQIGALGMQAPNRPKPNPLVGLLGALLTLADRNRTAGTSFVGSAQQQQDQRYQEQTQKFQQEQQKHMQHASILGAEANRLAQEAAAAQKRADDIAQFQQKDATDRYQADKIYGGKIDAIDRKNEFERPTRDAKNKYLLDVKGPNETLRATSGATLSGIRGDDILATQPARIKGMEAKTTVALDKNSREWKMLEPRIREISSKIKVNEETATKLAEQTSLLRPALAMQQIRVEAYAQSVANTAAHQAAMIAQGDQKMAQDAAKYMEGNIRSAMAGIKDQANAIRASVRNLETIPGPDAKAQKEQHQMALQRLNQRYQDLTNALSGVPKGQSLGSAVSQDGTLGVPPLRGAIQKPGIPTAPSTGVPGQVQQTSSGRKWKVVG